MYDFDFYAASEHLDVLDESLDGQRRCYAAFGAEAAAKRPESLEGITLITVRRSNGDMVGGIRMHRRVGDRPLPVQVALADKPDIVAAIGRHSQNTAELCGLWVDRSCSGEALSALLVETAIAIAPLVGVDEVMSFGHQHNWFVGITGMIPDADLGTHAYPDDRYQTVVFWSVPEQMPRASQLKVWEIRRSFLGSGRYRWDPQYCLVYHMAHMARAAARKGAVA